MIVKMANNVDLIDILAFATDELLIGFNSASNNEERSFLLDNYLKTHFLEDANQMPDFEKDKDWFNVTEPLCREYIKGKLVILDFFTYCCINCMHVLPDLKLLESKFSVEEGLVIIGVHSPKFENEKDSANILSAIQRYNITHPIVNDANSSLWGALKVKCWPTFVVLSPTGIPLIALMGEGHTEFLNIFVQKSLIFFKNQNLLNKKQLPLNPSTNLMPASNLKFPAKITCLNELNTDMFAISDSGNHRVLIINFKGKVLYKIGGLEPGFSDGNFKKAKFNSPQGLTFLDGDNIIVADTENHAIRKIILSKNKVTTLVGTGKQGTDKIGGNLGIHQEISSPWDVVVYKTRDMDMSFHVDEKKVAEKSIILIAMAGTHQIWTFFVEGIIWWKFRKFEPQTCASIIGNGLEENRNNSYPQNAAFAQPSGLALAKNFLFIADSESSSIRKVSMLDGKVMPVVGGDRNPLNLFAYGDVDGKQYNAKLQHPLGLAYNKLTNQIFVADTYNHKIKSIDINNYIIESCVIKDSEQKLYQFNEPGGLCFDNTGKYMFVADTNNHSIQVVDMGIMKTYRLQLDFSKSFENSRESICDLRKGLPLQSCKKILLNLLVSLENDLKFTENIEQLWRITSHSSKYLINPIAGQVSNQSWPISIESKAMKSDEIFDEIKLNFYLSLCNNNRCIQKSINLEFFPTNQKQFIDSYSECINLIVSELGVNII